LTKDDVAEKPDKASRNVHLARKDDNSEPSGLAKYCNYDRVDLNAGDVISNENIVGKIVLLPSLGKVFRLVSRSIVGTELKFL
jgi:hypothetical protein